MLFGAAPGLRAKHIAEQSCQYRKQNVQQDKLNHIDPECPERFLQSLGITEQGIEFLSRRLRKCLRVKLAEYLDQFLIA